MSNVEQFWDAARKHFDHPTPSWNELNPVAQLQVIQGINLILSAIYMETV